VYLDRLVRANTHAFREVLNMSEAVKEIFLESAEKYGWLNDRYVDKKQLNDMFVEKEQIAKKLLSIGISVEKVAEATELPVDTVESLL